MEITLQFVKMDLKLKDVQNLEQYRFTGTVYQIIISEAAKKEFFKHQVIADLRLKTQKRK